ncbi:MAG: phosphatidylglycerophosphatase A [Betaproteobacteria bacterium]
MTAAPPLEDGAAPRPRRATWRFMGLHPLRLIALGFGSGLSPVAPGTAGTLAGWALFAAIERLAAPSPAAWGAILVAGFLVGWWACTHTARAMAVSDPGAIVWDEIIAFWIILWAAMPVGVVGQLILFGLFRLFDAVKRGPVGWADACFKPKPGALPGRAQGFGIIFDDLVAAACVLVVWFAALRGWTTWQATH